VCIQGFHPWHLVTAIPGSDWVFSSRELHRSLSEHVSIKTTEKLGAIEEHIKLTWPRFLENEKKEEVGYTPLHLACMFGSRTVVQGILNAGANSKVHTPRGWNAVELASYRSGMLDLQYDVTVNFFRAVHLDLLKKFVEGPSLNIKGMKGYLRERDLNEWAELIEAQYGKDTQKKKSEGGELEFKGVMKAVNEIIKKHTEDQHKIDALPDLDEIYTLEEEFSKPSEEKDGGPVDKEGKGLPVVNNAPLGSDPIKKSQLPVERRSSCIMIKNRQEIAKFISSNNQKNGPIIEGTQKDKPRAGNGNSPPSKRKNSKLYLMSDRPLCSSREVWHLRQDYIDLQKLYLKLEIERERIGLEFQHKKEELKEAARENEEGKLKWICKLEEEERKWRAILKSKEDIGVGVRCPCCYLKDIYMELTKIFRADQKNEKLAEGQSGNMKKKREKNSNNNNSSPVDVKTAGAAVGKGKGVPTSSKEDVKKCKRGSEPTSSSSSLSSGPESLLFGLLAAVSIFGPPIWSLYLGSRRRL